MVFTRIKRGTTLETKLIKLKYMRNHNSFCLGPPIGASKPAFSTTWGLESSLSISILIFEYKRQEKKPHKFNIPVATIADFASTMQKKCLTFPAAKSFKKQANWAHKHKISEGGGHSPLCYLTTCIERVLLWGLFTSSFGFQGTP